MRLTENDDMIQALAADRPDQPFGKSILPRQGWGGRLVPNAHGAQSACDDGTIDTIPVSDEVARILIPRECLRYLAGNPLRCRVGCDMDPDEVSAREPIHTGHVWTAGGWQELFSRLQHWSVQPCVRPLGAAHMTAGHNALRADRVPTNTSHSRMPWHMWVVLIAGSTGSALHDLPAPERGLPSTSGARAYIMSELPGLQPFTLHVTGPLSSI